MFKQLCALLKPKPAAIVVAQDESLAKKKPAAKRVAAKKPAAKKTAAKTK